MTKVRSSILFCATICSVIVLALVVGALTYGYSSGHFISHGSSPPPDDNSDKTFTVHGSSPPPDDTPLFVAHGSSPPPDDNSGTPLA